MPYSVDILDRDENFLATCIDIPEAKRAEIREQCQAALANILDDDRSEPTTRINPDLFLLYYHFRDENSVFRILRFVVDDSAITYGVLRVKYVDVIESKQLRQLDAFSN